MRKPPPFFQSIADDARRRWQQLDADPELAGPWHVLFTEVKRPRFVLSEMLQNADDAGATRAAARIDGGVFEFRHNGEDFDPETLRALCSFGRSSKRRVHSIGLWGIGFKSLFSLGPEVEVLTPTVAIAFREECFSEPHWLEHAPLACETVIRVRFRSGAEERRIEGEFARWKSAPWALLFLQSVRALELQGDVIQREHQGPGPTARSHRFSLSPDPNRMVVVFRSEPLRAPELVVNEVGRLRRAPVTDFPPVYVEVVVGTGGDGSLFCGLPTDFKVAVPFTVNAPFVLEPGREFPKDPDVSPTNQWLLRCVGRLLASELLAWLANVELSIEDRAKAYALLPQLAKPKGQDLADRVLRIIHSELTDALQGQPLVLCTDGELRAGEGALDVPSQLQAVWEADELGAIAGRTNAVPVAPPVPPRAREWLNAICGLERNNEEAVVGWLASGRRIPRPGSLDAVKLLWTYLDKLPYSVRTHEMAILPVNGGDELLPQARVSVVYHEGELTPDLALLFRFRPIIDREFLASCRKLGDEPQSSSWDRLARQLVLGWLGKGVKSIRDALADLAPSIRKEGKRETTLAFGRCAFQLRARLMDDAPFLCEDGGMLPAAELYADFHGAADHFLPERVVTHIRVSSEYIRGMSPIEVGEFADWLLTNHVDRFPSPVPVQNVLWSRSELEEFVRTRRGGSVTYQIKRHTFRLTDRDFPRECWEHWSGLSETDPDVWAKLTVLLAGTSFAKDLTPLRVHQLGNNNEYELSCGQPISAWITRLSERSCISLNGGGTARPAETFRRTEATIHLHGHLPFLKEELDRDELANFWDALGVRTHLTDTGPVLDLWERLAGKDVNASLLDLGRLLDGLDSQGFATEAWAEIRNACLKKPLVPAEDGTWQRLGGLVLENPDHLPASLTIHPALHDLGVWRRLRVPTRPSRDVALAWARGLPEGEVLDRGSRARLSSVLAAYPSDIAGEVRHWLSVRGHWSRVGDFRYVLGEPLPVELFDGIAAFIADTVMLPGGMIPEPLASLPNAAGAVLTRVEARGATPMGRPDWVTVATNMLLTAAEPDDGDREVLERLRTVGWSRADSLEVTPYLEATPAGPLASPRAVWDDESHIIYITASPANCASEVLEEITRRFASRSLKRALTQCYDRPAEWIESCLRGTDDFTLEALVPTGSPEQDEIPSQPGNALLSAPRALRTPIRPDDRAEPSVAVGAHQRVETGERNRPLVLAFLRHLGLTVDDAGLPVQDDGTIVPKVFDNGVLKLLGPNGEILREAWVTEQPLTDGLTIPADVWSGLQRLGERAWIVCQDRGEAVFEHPSAFKVYPAEYRLRYLETSSATPSSGAE